MKTITLAILISTLASGIAMADESLSSAKPRGQWVFPPITQTLGYTYDKALKSPMTSPAKGTLAFATATDGNAVDASGRISPPITEMMGETHSRALHQLH